MKKWKWFLGVFLCSIMTLWAQCPTLSTPRPGQTNVPVDVTLSWPKVDGVRGYVVSIGTTPDGVDIVNRRTSGPINSFTPELGLPENEQIYVSIILLFLDGTAATCGPMTFSTGDVTTPPPCTQLVSPFNGETAVSTGTILEWEYASTATGYVLSIGTSPGANDILNNQDVGNRLTYRPPNDLPLDTTVYVTIVPYNENGNKGPCQQESFTTNSSGIDCGPFVNNSNGQTYYWNPELHFPAKVGLCEDGAPQLVLLENNADGYRWFQIHPDGTETLISGAQDALITEVGHYRVESFNNIRQRGSTGECASIWEFEAISSTSPVITRIEVGRDHNTMQLQIRTAGNGNYEYAVDDEMGLYQDSPFFEDLDLKEHTVFVRDKDGCGSAQQLVERNLSSDDFPKFFTPNGDLVNDYWQYIPPENTAEFTIVSIHIFDRYGNLLAEVDPNSLGWDGQCNGHPMPATNYWYKAVSAKKQEIAGHFALKR